MVQPVPFDTESIAQLRGALLTLSRRLRQESPGDISATELSVLGRVRRYGPLTPGALAELEHVRPPSISRVIERLESAGHLQRAPHPEDQRRYLVSATREGAEFLARTREHRNQWLAVRLASLTPADQEAVAGALDALQHLAETP